MSFPYVVFESSSYALSGLPKPGLEFVIYMIPTSHHVQYKLLINDVIITIIL